MKNNPVKYEKPNISGLLSGNSRILGNENIGPEDPEPIDDEPIGASEEGGGSEWDD